MKPAWMFGRGRRLLAFLLLAATPPMARGDYLSDRHWPHLPPGRRAGRQVLRVYVARESINDCPRRVEDCIRYQGRPDERRRVSPDEEHLIYRGPKTLYRGTGEANTAVGPEWKEYVVRGGQIAEQFAAVQVMETGYPWLAEAGAEEHCEAYGKKNTKSCCD